MTEAARIIDELNRAIEGDPWHGDPLARILEGVNAARAGARPLSQAHSIWEIVRHLTSWTHEVAHRLAGHPSGVPAQGDWPAPGGTDEAAWRRDVSRLFEAHRRLVAAVAAYSDEVLLAPTADPRNRHDGTGVTRYVLLHGLSQHYAYHGGQIAILKK